jgi:hypothetical protein
MPTTNTAHATTARWIVSLGLTVLSACGDSKERPTAQQLAEYSISYRSRIRVPSAGARLKHSVFVEQVERQDPIEAIRCPVSNAEGFQKASDDLGGITWTHPVAVLKDLSRPILYRGRLPPDGRGESPTAGADNKAASPTIERPDLVGYQESTAIFLSQRHGLLAVNTDGKLEVSCALKLPGQPKYFFYKGNELVLLVNGSGVNQAALLRFRVKSPGFDFVDSVMLTNQQIQDARLFNRTLVVYTNTFDPAPPAPEGGGGIPTGTGTTQVPPAAGAGSSGQARAPGSDVAVRPDGYGFARGVKLAALEWGADFKLVWQEEFPNDPSVNVSLPGLDPGLKPASQLRVGDVVATYKRYKNFVSASDRYLVVSRDINRTVFTGTENHSYTACTSSHEGPPQTYTYCSPKYEQRKNPDYRDPRTTKGDYACNGKKLQDCIQEAAPQVSRYIHVRVGESCQTYSHRNWICDKFETVTTAYPTYRNDASTQFVVYRYEGGDFVKLDEQLFEMQDPEAAGGDVESLSFLGKPLELPGVIDHKGDLQFQHGHFYVLTAQGETLHTMLLIGNSIARLSTKDMPRQKKGFSYSGAHSTLFSDDRMMVSRAFADVQNRPIPHWSDVLMLDLTMPSFPKTLNQFVMPGSSDQLILANTGVLGPGTVSFTGGGVSRNLQKITLFDRRDAAELDNILLGSEFNADFSSSWLGAADDQRIRFDGESNRLFLPYSGYHHVPDEVFNPVAHRLNIAHVGDRKLISEKTFDLAEDIIRTVSLDSRPTTGRALAFGDSSVYAINQGDDSWTVDVIQEYATPIAVYRINDEDVHVRIDRLGTRCQISTFAAGARVFKKVQLAVGPKVDCREGVLPMGIRSSVVFADSKTGWKISPDGLTITAATPREVTSLLALIPQDTYCTLDAGKEDATPVEFLDEVPTHIDCFPLPVEGSGGVTKGGGVDVPPSAGGTPNR